MPQNETNLFVPETPTPVVSPTEAELPNVEQVIKIHIDELKPNSIIVIKIAPEGMRQRVAATQQIAMALRPLAQQVRDKNVAFIVMGTDETMDVLEESQMNDLGWEKKEKSRIITL